MPNFSQNVANKQYCSPSQYARDLLAFRRGKAYFRLSQVIGEQGIEDLAWAICLATDPQKTEFVEMYMRAWCR